MSLREKFTGTGVAIATPFDAQGNIDYPAFEKLINHIINGKCEYIVVLGTTGESATIHGKEKQEVFSFVNKVNNARVALIAGIGGNDTAEILHGFKEFDLTGYDAILVVSPYYNKPNQDGLFQHYKILNEHTPLPIMMYNVPGRTGQNVSAETTVRIAKECKKIFATKEACGNFDQFHYIIKNKPESFMVISGDDGIALPMIAIGAEGVVSVVANAYPKGFSEMTRLALKGDYDAARKLHYNYTDIINSMFAEGSPSGLKAYLSEMGIGGNYFRMPVWPVSEKHHAKIKELMKTVSE
ncbi:MAG: 4-hydroxy-tetrahydrodipicolinate synthase [Sphingobacteriales bacterium]|nr:4-hydroxy-tetrahydrodipicolinate synthase [Sphingobacteriales bacterium]MBI3718562.1 4-hydroxy-tetrahydrodipicolinate synthase [Sphingobacteriales bacterium]